MPVHLYAYRYRYINKAYKYKQTIAIVKVTKNSTYSIHTLSILKMLVIIRRIQKMYRKV